MFIDNPSRRRFPMKNPKTKVLIAAAVAAIAVIAIAAYIISWRAKAPPAAPKIKEVLIIGTTDSVQSTLDPCEAYDYLGVNIIQNMGGGPLQVQAGDRRAR